MQDLNFCVRGVDSEFLHIESAPDYLLVRLLELEVTNGQRPVLRPALDTLPRRVAMPQAHLRKELQVARLGERQGALLCVAPPRDPTK